MLKIADYGKKRDAVFVEWENLNCDQVHIIFYKTNFQNRFNISAVFDFYLWKL